ncbi:MAG: Rv1355c family protein [Bacteroidota bacterium]
MKYNQCEVADDIYLPELFSLKNMDDRLRHAGILADHPEIKVLDFFHVQKQELIKTRQPGKNLAAESVAILYQQWLAGKDVSDEGCWVYYSWLNTLVHILEENEFVELRTNRNHYKITPAEQQQLALKKIGIIGLSVGHAVALCMATERICGTLKLADFDSIELSNLNRIKTGIVNIGINKCIATAREIAEIDPFIKIQCYSDGINDDNVDDFLLEGGKLDILVDECDGLDIKIQSRIAAKKYRIPVVMETSDKGMLDVERFDLEPNRDILHGLLHGIPLEKLKNLTNEQKIPLILKIADVSKGSLRGKVSMLEVGQSISTWPQLASAVTLGGGVVTDVCRRILLDQYKESGRYYIDLETLAGNTRLTPAELPGINPFQPFNFNSALASVHQLQQPESVVKPSIVHIEQMIEASALAPSTGNDQPWKWIYHEGNLYLFHDAHRSYCFGDFDKIASYISLGAAYENLLLKSNQLGYTTTTSLFPLASDPQLIAVIQFVHPGANTKTDSVYEPQLVGAIKQRCTNRNPAEAAFVSPADLSILEAAAKSVYGAVFHCVSNKKEILSLGRIIGECDRIRLLNKQGHRDFAEREMRWTPASAEASRDGIDIRTLGVSGPLLAALSIIKDADVTACLKEINGGKALVDAAVKTVDTASFIGVITLPKYGKEDFFAGGISMQRLWLKATELGYAIHPLISPFYLFPRITKGNGAGLDKYESNRLKALRHEFANIIPLNDDTAEVFIFKIAKAENPAIKTLRLPLNEILFATKK